jgi:predicted dehydrogenase
MKLPGVRVTAVCDLDSKRCAEAKTFVEEYYLQHNIKYNPVSAYAHYKDMLADKSIDAVVICTPDHWHALPTVEAALAGKHIYLEKPASLTLEEGRLMSNIVHRTGVVFQFGTQQRSWEQFRVACELVRNGKIGKIHTVKIGLPTDPSGDEEPEMPVPPNLNYEMWLGSTPWVHYTEKRVHPQSDYSRPGWLRCEQFGCGMITGWGVHHVDIAHWAMDKEYTGPVELTAEALFPASGLWNVHGKYRVEAKYENGVTLLINDEFPNGIRFEGDEGWIFVTRGNYSVTASDPNKNSAGQAEEPLQASDAKILKAGISDGDFHLEKSNDHHANWIDAIRNRKQPICNVEVAHRSTSACLISHIGMKLRRRLHWDPRRERFLNDDEANSMLSRAMRYPYQIDIR